MGVLLAETKKEGRHKLGGRPADTLEEKSVHDMHVFGVYRLSAAPSHLGGLGCPQQAL